MGHAAVAEKLPRRSGVWIIRGSHHLSARCQASRAVLPTRISISPLSSGARRSAFKPTNGSSRRLQAPPLERRFCPAPGVRGPARAATEVRLAEPGALFPGEEVVKVLGLGHEARVVSWLAARALWCRRSRSASPFAPRNGPVRAALRMLPAAAGAGRGWAFASGGRLCVRWAAGLRVVVSGGLGVRPRVGESWGAGEGSEEIRGWASPCRPRRSRSLPRALGRAAVVTVAVPRRLGGRTRRSRGRGSSPGWLRGVLRALPSACAGDGPLPGAARGCHAPQTSALPATREPGDLGGPPLPRRAASGCTRGVVRRAGFGGAVLIR